jgi:hypothetical protein
VDSHIFVGINFHGLTKNEILLLAFLSLVIDAFPGALNFMVWWLPRKLVFKNEHICSMCRKINKVGKQEVGIWWVQKRFPRYGVPIWRLWPNIRSLINSCWEKCDEICAYMFIVYEDQLSRQTGSRNLTGPKTLPTIWYTYMMFVTKY